MSRISAALRELRHDHPFLLLLMLAASAVGIVARLKGLGAAPLAIDEYYLVRSADNVLRHGAPTFDCGGWYTRGILLQYLIAALRGAGLSAELAPRIIAAASSLLALPAAYILGSRAYGRTAGLLAITLLAVSVWEVEMARFGRMYAPFQAVFLWYLVFFLRYTLDRDAKALWAMLLLTVVATLTWEGGVFVALANLLPPFLRYPTESFNLRKWQYLAVTGGLLLLIYIFTTADFRYTAVPALPQGYAALKIPVTADILATSQDPLRDLLGKPVWLAFLTIPLATALFALYGIWRKFGPGLAGIGLCTAVVTALMHQFAAAIAAIILVLLFELTRWRQLFSRDAIPVYVSLGVSALFWIAFILAASGLHRPETAAGAPMALALAHQFFQFPDVADVVARPWYRAVPVLGLGLLLLLIVAVLRAGISKQEIGLTAARVLIIVLVCMLIAVGASHPPRHETRYVYFLYPIAIVVALGTIARLFGKGQGSAGVRAAAIPLIALSAFALSEDFSARHLSRIDTAPVVFRADMPAARASHLVVRTDTRAVSRWLHAHANQPGDLVITGYHSLEYYYPKVDYFFVDWRDRNFRELSCAGGTVDRWSNLPLIYNVAALRDKVGAGSRAFVVMFSDRLNELTPHASDLNPVVVFTTQNVAVLRLEKPAHPITHAARREARSAICNS